MLLAAANNAPKYEVMERGGFQIPTKDGVAVIRVSREDAFCTAVHDWMHHLVDEGVTDDLLEELFA